METDTMIGFSLLTGVMLGMFIMIDWRFRSHANRINRLAEDIHYLDKRLDEVSDWIGERE